LWTIPSDQFFRAENVFLMIRPNPRLLQPAEISRLSGRTRTVRPVQASSTDERQARKTRRHHYCGSLAQNEMSLKEGSS